MCLVGAGRAGAQARGNDEMRYVAHSTFQGKNVPTTPWLGRLRPKWHRVRPPISYHCANFDRMRPQFRRLPSTLGRIRHKLPRDSASSAQFRRNSGQILLDQAKFSRAPSESGRIRGKLAQHWPNSGPKAAEVGSTLADSRPNSRIRLGAGLDKPPRRDARSRPHSDTPSTTTGSISTMLGLYWPMMSILTHSGVITATPGGLELGVAVKRVRPKFARIRHMVAHFKASFWMCKQALAKTENMFAEPGPIWPSRSPKCPKAAHVWAKANRSWPSSTST